jgi:hypothetical protein
MLSRSRTRARSFPVVGQEGKPILGERRAEHVAQEALARRLVLDAGDAGRMEIEPQLLHHERTRRGGASAGAGELHGGTAAQLGAGRRQSGDCRGRELGQHRVARGQLVIHLERFGQQTDHATAPQVAQGAYARNLQHVADLVRPQPG